MYIGDQRIFTDTRNPQIVRFRTIFRSFSLRATPRYIQSRTQTPTPRAAAARVKWKQKSNEFNFDSILFSVLIFAVVCRAKLFCCCHIFPPLDSAFGAFFVWARACTCACLRNSK